MLNSQTVGKRDNRFVLLVVTMLFVFFGGFLVYISLDKVLGINSCKFNDQSFAAGSEIPGYKQGFTCNCEGGEVTCVKVDTDTAKPTLDKFTRKNLTVKPKYLVGGLKDTLDSFVLKTRFVSVSTKAKSIDITIEQHQKCSADSRIPIQVGMYYLTKDTLYITNVINNSPTNYVLDCTVSVHYRITDWDYDGRDLDIVYLDDSGQIEKASLCYYEKNIYANGDIYSASDKCNICSCQDGVSKCSNDRVCKQ
ncbi:hypothetical protein IT417_01390 [bacterium]|nr:hypothetical protein [bacterium]